MSGPQRYGAVEPYSTRSPLYGAWTPAVIAWILAELLQDALLFKQLLPLVFKLSNPSSQPFQHFPNNLTVKKTFFYFPFAIIKRPSSPFQLPTTNTCLIWLALGIAVTANRDPTPSTFTLCALTVVASAATIAPLDHPHQTRPPQCTAVPTNYLPFRLHHHTSSMSPHYLLRKRCRPLWTTRISTKARRCLVVLGQQCLGPNRVVPHTCISAASVMMGLKSTISNRSVLYANILLANPAATLVSSAG